MLYNQISKYILIEELIIFSFAYKEEMVNSYFGFICYNGDFRELSFRLIYAL